MCANKDEAIAIGVKKMQTELMVAALSCNQRNSYNQFVRKYNMDLAHNGRMLRSYFQRNYGGAAEYHMNRFVTGLANAHSSGSLKATEMEYCGRINELFSRSLSSKITLAELSDTSGYTSASSSNCASHNQVAQKP